jgi:hypothetical protein
LAQREADYRKRQTENAEAGVKAEKERADAAKRAETCAQFKAQLRQMGDSQVVIYRYNEKGEREVMDDAAIARERTRINTLLRDNKCPA